jgi:PAS domain S-box-containing protein
MMQSVGPDGKYLLVNREWRERLGYGGSDLKRLTFMDVVRKDFREHCANAFKQVSAGKSLYGIDVVFVAKDGSEMEVSGNIRPVMKDGKFIYTVGSFVDVTERKKAENITRDFAKKLEREVETRTEELHASNEELKATDAETDRLRLYADSVIGSINSNVIVLDKDGRVTTFNPPAATMFGLTEKKALGKSFYELEIAGKMKGLKESIRKVMSTRKPYEVKSLPYVAPGGKTRLLDLKYVPLLNEAGELQGTVSIADDVTDRMALEKKALDVSKALEVTSDKLQKTSGYARSLLEASLDPLMTISASGKITDVNGAVITVTGIPKDELIGNDFSRYFTEPAMAKASYLEVLRKGFVKDYHLVLKHKSGKFMEVLFNASVYKDANGKVLGVFAAARDATDLVKLGQLQEANQKLEASTEELRATNEALVERNRELEEFREFAVTREADFERLKKKMKAGK